MSLRFIPVQTFDIDIELVVQDLKDHGVVVLVTTRTHSKQVADEAVIRLGIDTNDQEGPYLQHLSFEVDDGGWEDCLMYSETADYQPEELREITMHAIRDWIASGRKKYHLYTIHT